MRLVFVRAGCRDDFGAKDESIASGLTVLLVAASLPALAQTQNRLTGAAERLSQADVNTLTDLRISLVKSASQLTLDQERLWPPIEDAIRARAQDREERVEATVVRADEWRVAIARWQKLFAPKHRGRPHRQRSSAWSLPWLGAPFALWAGHRVGACHNVPLQARLRLNKEEAECGRKLAMRRGRDLPFGWTGVPAFHPEFGYMCPSANIRRLIFFASVSIAAVGVAVGAMTAARGFGPGLAANRSD
jgi:hypothetical protein